MIEEAVGPDCGDEMKACSKYETNIDANNAPMYNFDEKSPTNPLIIFDWDDTLLPSTYIHENGLRLESEVPPNFYAAISPIEKEVTSLLQTAKQHGDVCIITNAETGWVELSCKKFMPNVWTVVRDISVCSARSSYEHLHPSSPISWKTEAFSKAISVHLTNLGSNSPRESKLSIISVGDSLSERQALSKSARNYENVYAKSIKFNDKPTIEELQYQMHVIFDCFSWLTNHPGNLDLMLKPSESN